MAEIPRTEVEARTSTRIRRYRLKVQSLLQHQDVQETTEFITSGAYARASGLGTDHFRSFDLFVAIVRGTNTVRIDIDYRLAVFDAFVRNGAVFHDADRMASIVTFLHESNPFIMIVASLIPNATWALIPRAIFQTAPTTPPELLRQQIRFCIEFGARTTTVIPLATVMALEQLNTDATSADDVVIEFADEVGPVDENNQPLTAHARQMLETRFQTAMRRFCLKAFVRFAIGTVGLGLSPFVLIEMAEFAVPCFYKRVIPRLQALRILDRVRRAYIAAGEQRAAELAEDIQDEYEAQNE